MKKFFTLELAVEFYEASRGIPMQPHLKSQYLRACSSVALNLSEGSAKPTASDRRKFYHIALGSHRECQTILRLHGQAPAQVRTKADFLGVCLYRLCKATG